jgi:hypothetical protein
MDMYQLPGGEDKNSPRIIGSLAIQPPRATASPRILYWSINDAGF